eukprot:2470501-Amphidinium_carterae.2
MAEQYSSRDGQDVWTRQDELKYQVNRMHTHRTLHSDVAKASDTAWWCCSGLMHSPSHDARAGYLRRVFHSNRELGKWIYQQAGLGAQMFA